ncbi:DUF7344 domain-containing protein [Halorientalis litorea]|jgi:hypothetical protein|uniref:DUF7344 domain-containing protein n=1 Tax=Halorientalis litorea TaxID=2931977 RepID=UPI001FF64860|nr:hypothetical protein [Halorientalis litorea]
MATHSNPSTDRRGDRHDGLPAAVVEELLASRARRRILAHLRTADRPVAVGDLAELVATGDLTGDASAAKRRQARREIYQTHLPILTATGTVAFNSMLGTVEFTGCPAVVARLERVTEVGGP